MKKLKETLEESYEANSKLKAEIKMLKKKMLDNVDILSKDSSRWSKGT